MRVLFGGTFDPIHHGHLRLALEVQEWLACDQLYLLPSHQPPHRDTPDCSSADRVAMVELAVKDCPQLGVDTRELERNSPSYMVDTLAEVRAEIGSDHPLVLVVGMDSLVTLDSWHRWQHLLDFAHLLVISRPGYVMPAASELADFIDQHKTEEKDCLHQHSHGHIVFAELSLLPIAATHIREQIRQGRSPQFLLPDSVWQYIRHHRLYGFM